MSTSTSAGVGDLPCFPTFPLSLMELKIPNFPCTFCLLFCNIIMTDELMHIALKEMRAPDLTFSSEYAPHGQLSMTDSKLK